MHALPLTYGKDMQEDKEPLFDAIDTVELCLDATEGMLAGIEFDRERLEAASGDEMLAATEIADLLVRKGVPFREAHGIVGGLVRDAVERRQAPLRADPRGAARALRAPRRLLLRGARAQQLAGVEADRGRHRLGAARGADRARPRDARRRSGRGWSKSGNERARRPPERLGVEFFDRSVHEVARELIGCRLFYEGCGGTIVETESYERDDPACHAYVGLTRADRDLFGPPGRAYVYLSYGIHSLLNFVAEPEGEAAAVLIRALEPTAGLERDARARAWARPDTDLCSGPGKLTEALGIGLDDNGADLARDPFLLLPPEDGERPEVVTGPRIGITKAVERPWRFCAAPAARIRLASAPNHRACARPRVRDR